MTYLVIAAFIAILGSLGAALFFMMRGNRNAMDPKAKASGMAKALAFRVGFSILLFVAVLVSYWMGWIQPTGIPPGR